MGGEDGGNLKPAMHELLENEASCLEVIGARVISDGSVANGTSFWIDADVFPQLLETNGFLSFFMASPKYSSPSSVFPYACPLDHSNHRRARAGLRLACRICWPFILIEAVNLCLSCTSRITAENKTCPTDPILPRPFRSLPCFISLHFHHPSHCPLSVHRGSRSASKEEIATLPRGSTRSLVAALGSASSEMGGISLQGLLSDGDRRMRRGRGRPGLGEVRMNLFFNDLLK